MNKKISLGAAVSFMLIVAAVTFSITMILSERMFNGTVSDLKERERRYSKIAEIDDLTRQNYIGNLDQSALMDALSAGFLKGTGDTFAKYYTAAEYARMQGSLTNKTVQIGIRTDRDESGYIRVAQVYPDSPAEAAGIAPEDLIVKVDDLDVTAESYVEAVAKLQGEAGTKVNLVVRRGTDERTLDNLARRYVEVPSVFSSMLDNTVGLVRISEFNDGTPEQFTRQVDALIDQGANSLIFDVRGVNAGTLPSVSQVLDKLVPEGVLVYSQDKDGNTTVLEQSDAREVTLPMVIVVNEETSGEAELFAQVLTDFGKAKIVGARTAGKGTMQRTFKLLDGSAVELTTELYKPPVSPSYDQVGVKPDYEVKMSEGQANLAEAGYQDGDAQMKKAMEVAMAAMRSAGIDFTSQVLAGEEAQAPAGSASQSGGQGTDSAGDLDSQEEDAPESREDATADSQSQDAPESRDTAASGQEEEASLESKLADSAA